ncbi:hypothetical protein TRIUR3_21455 [Triticum urartu]|uniref:Bifunctional inhibitor/plant lipid transfer protein/seed storage helical domain-containing protein n=1 Tax=Triticum urartu TaxID=4572 RepID=M7Z7K0_TRIUA|nr:hypothetical protein TRIUR3_21455 [Triticum urartu]
MAKLMCLCFIILTIGVAVSADECEGDRQEMIKECAKYQQWPANPKLDPSDACCAVWQKENIPCLCAGVTKEKEKIYCMEKVTHSLLWRSDSSLAVGGEVLAFTFHVPGLTIAFHSDL